MQDGKKKCPARQKRREKYNACGLSLNTPIINSGENIGRRGLV